MNKTTITVVNLLLVLLFGGRITEAVELVQASDYEQVIDAGKVPVSKPLKSSFTFASHSDTPYTIKTITTSCECVSILSYEKTIRAHCPSTVKLLYVPDMKGDFAYTITIIPVDPEQPEYTFLMMTTVYDDGVSSAKKLIRVAPEMLTRVIRKPAEEYYISANNALRMLKSNSATFVDIRQPDEYNLSNIPDSINMPLYAVKTKPFLRSKPVVLIDKGTQRQTVEEECTLLRKAGFDAYILEGGLNYWSQCEYPLSGNFFAQHDLNFIDPVELYMDRHFSNWLVVDVSSRPPDMLPLIPDCLHIPVDANSAFVDTLRNYIHDVSADTLVSVVIISDAPEDYEKIMVLSSSIKNAQFYFVDGGKEAYRQFMQTQMLMLHPPQHTRRQKTCGTCPQEQINTVINN